MKITNLKIYDTEETFQAVTFPMSAKYDVDTLADALERGYNRLFKLSQQPHGTGHDNALSGILVSMNITASVKWYEQFQRYHFKQIVSSQSTMHRLRKMLIHGDATFAKETNPKAIELIKSLAMDDTVTAQELAYSCPMGLELTARITTNYLQLKTIYLQRRNHKLEEWHEFCHMIEELPYSKLFIL